jgi:hypothetical protein
MTMMVVTVLQVVPMVSGIVAMVNVSPKAMYVMAQVNSVMLDGALTAPMVQMKA